MNNKLENLSDLELIEAYKNGDETAFDHIYSRYHSRILRFSQKMTSNIAEAEDLTHYCFLILLQNIDKIHTSQKALIFYLLSIAKNKIYKNIRDHDKEDLCSEIPVNKYINTHNPAKDLLSKELSQQLILALEHLPLHYKHVLLLHDDEGFTISEISQILEESTHAIRMRLYRARELFKSFICVYLNNSQSLKSQEIVKTK